MAVQKRTWRQPELTVLVRGKPEEAVLTGCKGKYDAGPDRAGYNQCELNAVYTCGECASETAS